MVLKVLPKVSPYTGIGPWMALPRDSSISHGLFAELNNFPLLKWIVRARKRHINVQHINFLKVGTTLGQPAG